MIQADLSTAAKEKMEGMDLNDILNYLPHRYPFLLIDRILVCTPGESLVALKNVSYNEHFFQGHFPMRPVMPAVLILEAMAQATGILAVRTFNAKLTDKSIYYFVGIDHARFRQPVEPGDQLIIETRLLRGSRRIWKGICDVKVDGKVVANAELLGTLRELDT